MASAVGEAKQTLRLALRPDDPFAVPLQAERVRASRLGVLLKVGIRGDALEFPMVSWRIAFFHGKGRH